MTLVDDILSGNWVTGLAIGVGAVVTLPLATPIFRPLAKTAIKGGILAYQGAAELIEGIGDLVVESVAEGEKRVALAARCWRLEAVLRARPPAKKGPGLVGKI